MREQRERKEPKKVSLTCPVLSLSLTCYTFFFCPCFWDCEEGSKVKRNLPWDGRGRIFLSCFLQRFVSSHSWKIGYLTHCLRNADDKHKSILPTICAEMLWAALLVGMQTSLDRCSLWGSPVTVSIRCLWSEQSLTITAQKLSLLPLHILWSERHSGYFI